MPERFRVELSICNLSLTRVCDCGQGGWDFSTINLVQEETRRKSKFDCKQISKFSKHSPRGWKSNHNEENSFMITPLVTRDIDLKFEILGPLPWAGGGGRCKLSDVMGYVASYKGPHTSWKSKKVGRAYLSNLTNCYLSHHWRLLGTTMLTCRTSNHQSASPAAEQTPTT